MLDTDPSRIKIRTTFDLLLRFCRNYALFVAISIERTRIEQIRIHFSEMFPNI